MGNATDQVDGASRRRSLLPQPRGNKQDPPPMKLLAKQNASTAERTQRSTATVPRGSKTVEAAPRKTSMLPPSGFRSSRLARVPTNTSSSQRPSTGKVPSQDSHETLALARSSSARQEPQNNIRSLHHGRSVSHQVERAIPALSTFRTTLNRQSSARGQKPMFTAMQQTFTSKRPGSSRPSSPSVLPVGQEDIASTDCFHSQMELAQLHLMHRSALSVQLQWEQSAEEVFRHRFTAICERHIELKEISQQQQALINSLALVQWADGRSGSLLAEKVALLSRRIAEICSLVDYGGKYNRTLDIFESWFGQVLRIRKQRQLGSVNGDNSMDFVEGIGDGWKAEAMVLERELTYLSRDLGAFGSVQATSSLGRVQALYSKLVLNLIEELDVIQWIENEITIQETSWVEQAIDGLASTVDNDLGSIASRPGMAKK